MNRLITVLLYIGTVHFMYPIGKTNKADNYLKNLAAVELDWQSKIFLDNINAQSNPPLATQSIEMLRNSPTFKGYKSDASISHIEDITVPGPHGPILLRLYSPLGKGPFPVLVFYHGGGWVAGDLQYSDAFCREICNQAAIIVVSIDYRLAPEHKFPIPLNDCYAATIWAAQNIQKYNGDPKRLVISGASSGGNLAAAVALMAREKKTPSIISQVLIYPALDTNFETGSYQQFSEGYRLTRKNMQWFWKQYLESEADEQNFYATPLKVPDVSKLPRAMIVTAYFDPLRDDGAAYAERLHSAGIPVLYKTYNSIHPFIALADQLDIGKKGIADIAEYLRNALH